MAEPFRLELSETFVAPDGDRMSLPIRLGGGNRPIVELGHWADGSSRNSFKLYAGNRSADGIARAMLTGVREKPKKNQAIGGLRTKGIRQLWEERKDELIAQPLHVLTPMGGQLQLRSARSVDRDRCRLFAQRSRSSGRGIPGCRVPRGLGAGACTPERIRDAQGAVRGVGHSAPANAGAGRALRRL